MGVDVRGPVGYFLIGHKLTCRNDVLKDLRAGLLMHCVKMVKHI